MKCPVCEHVSDKVLQRCSVCDSVFDSQSLEELQHANYLLAWLDTQAQRIDPSVLELLRQDARRILEQTQKDLRLEELLATAEATPELIEPAEPKKPVISREETLRPIKDIMLELGLVGAVITYAPIWGQGSSIEKYFSRYDRFARRRADELRRQLETLRGNEAHVTVPLATELEALDYTIKIIPEWAKADGIISSVAAEMTASIERRQKALLKPVPAAEPAARAEPKTTRPKPARPKPPAKPKEPLIEWAMMRRRVIDAAASGALLRGLLYLGAFMIVISMAVLVINFWDAFPTLVQLGFIAAVPAAFYVLGWLMRTRLKLPQAGGVLTGVGMLLVAVDFTAVYRFGGLSDSVDPYLYWLGVSIFCTALYGFTAWRIPIEAFGTITLLALTSTMVSLGFTLRLTPDFIVVMLPLSALIMLGISVGLNNRPERWSPLANSARRLPYILIPVSQVVVLFTPGGLGWGQAFTYALAAVGYGLLALWFTYPDRLLRLFVHVAAWSSAAVIGFALAGVKLPFEWLAAAIALIAPLYLVAGRLLDTRGIWWQTKQKIYLEALYGAGFGLLIVAAASGMITLAFDLKAGAVALAIVSLVLTGCAPLFRRPLFLLAGAGLFILPFSIALVDWLRTGEVSHQASWLMVGWAALALIYLSAAFPLRRAAQYAIWLYLMAHTLAPAATLGLLFDYAYDSERWNTVPAVIALGGVLIVYLTSSLIHDSGRHPGLSRLVRWLPEPYYQSAFLWPLGLVAPLWISVAWVGSVIEVVWLGVILSSLALAYVGIGQLLIRRRQAYRLPFHLYAYTLVIAGISIALTDSWALLVSLLMSVAVLVALSMIYRRVWETAGAALLFVWPFQLALEMSPLTTHAYSLAYALLATLVYIPVALLLSAGHVRDFWIYDPDRRPSWIKTPQAMVVFVVGYGMAAYAVITSLLGRFDLYPLDVRWIGVMVPLIVCGLSIFSVYRLRQRILAWVAALLFAISYWQMLALLNIPPDWQAVAWISLALAYMFTERLLSHYLALNWWVDFRWPLGVTAVALSTLGLALTASPTYQAFFSAGESVEYLPIIIAQLLAVILTILGARLYRSRLPLFFEPVLSLFPVTLFFVGYSEQILGKPLATAHYSYVWLGLALVHLTTAEFLDTSKIRYSHGLYLGGYALTLMALGWSTMNWQTHIVTLGITVLIAAVSHTLVHFGRHRTWDQAIALIWQKPETVALRAARSAFLFIAVYAFPIWLIQLLAYNDVPLAWRGLAFALVAPLYIALGLWLKNVRAEYSWPLYSAGYALTAIGAMLANQDQRLFIAILCLNTVIYAVSAYIFRQAVWLYLSNTLIPVIVLLILDYNDRLLSPWIAGIFMGLAFLYLAIGYWFYRRRTEPGISSYALPFFILGYLLSALSLAVASGERTLATIIFSAAVVLYGASTWAFREPIFLYPAAWLAAVPYFLAMTFTQLPSEWWGLGLLPLIVLYILIGRFAFRKLPIRVKDWPEFLRALGRPSMPFYLLAYAFSVGMIVVSRYMISVSQDAALVVDPRGDLLPLTLALGAATVIYFASAALFRQFAWLYPGLLATHLAILSFLGQTPSDTPAYYVSLPFVAVTWIVALLGLAFERRAPSEKIRAVPQVNIRIWQLDVTLGGWPFAGRLITPSWAQPFFLFAAIDAVLWQLIALGSYETTIVAGLGFALLFGLLATLWQDGGLVYASLLYLLLASGARLGSAGMTLAQSIAWMAAIGLGLYIVGRLIELNQHLDSRLSAWPQPLERMAVLISSVAVIASLPTAASQALATAAALGFTGVLYLAIAYRGRYYNLGYLAMAILQIAWVLLLVEENINQPQLYAIPAGLYFIVIGELERRRGRNVFANYLITFGLAVIFVTSFIQSLNPDTGLPYFLLLLVESLLAIGYGVLMHEKVPFFAGIGAAFLNVTGQLILLAIVSDVMRWIVILGTGLILVSLAVLVERRREHIADQFGEWRATLSAWR